MLISLSFHKSSELTCLKWTQSSVREAILTLLRNISQSKLSKLCKISQPIISNIVNSKEFKLSQAKCEEFGKWYLEYQRSRHLQASVPQIEAGPSTSRQEDIAQLEGKSTLSIGSEARLTFHPKQEVPKLIEWFHLNRNPSDRELSCYAELLNQSPLRVERNKVTIKSLKNWWKNYKQKQRNEQKGKIKPKKK